MFLPSMKRDEKKTMLPDTFLKPISEAEAVTDMPNMRTFYLFVSSPMLSTLDYKVLKTLKKKPTKPHP